MTDEVLGAALSLLSALVGGVVVAIVNHLFTRRKTDAEAKKLEAEADKIRVETQKLVDEMAGIASTVREVSYKLGDAVEKALYDGSAHIDGADFRGEGDRFFGEPKERPKGAGSLKFDQGVLSIQRSNTGGRFRTTLLKYVYGGVVREYIPQNELIAGKRLLRLTCEAKALGGSHTVVFIIKRRTDGAWLDKHEQTFSRNEWEAVDAYLRIPPGDDCFLMIDDQNVTQANSSLQLRRLVLAERGSA